MEPTTLQVPKEQLFLLDHFTVSVSTEEVKSQTFREPSFPAQAPSRWECCKWERVTGLIPGRGECRRVGSAFEQEQLYASV